MSTFGLADEELTLQKNVSAINQISPLVRAAGLPLTVDIQDGYGSQLVEAVQSVITAGAVGANIEDSYPKKGHDKGLSCLRSIEEAADRIKLALRTAAEAGVPDRVEHPEAGARAHIADHPPELAAGNGGSIILKKRVRAVAESQR